MYELFEKIDVVFGGVKWVAPVLLVLAGGGLFESVAVVFVHDEQFHPCYTWCAFFGDVPFVISEEVQYVVQRGLVVAVRVWWLWCGLILMTLEVLLVRVSYVLCESWVRWVWDQRMGWCFPLRVECILAGM